MTSEQARGTGSTASFLLRRPPTDWFVAGRRGEIDELFAWANAERIVDVMHALLEQLEPAVDVVMTSRRHGLVWHGELLPLPDVRDAVGRMAMPLATYGGVELSVYTPDDQLTLTESLALVIYSKSDRWVYLLAGMGFVEHAVAPPPLWSAEASPLGEAPELDRVLRLAVERLGLEST